ACNTGKLSGSLLGVWQVADVRGRLTSSATSRKSLSRSLPAPRICRRPCDCIVVPTVPFHLKHSPVLFGSSGCRLAAAVCPLPRTLRRGRVQPFADQPLCPCIERPCCAPSPSVETAAKGCE